MNQKSRVFPRCSWLSALCSYLNRNRNGCLATCQYKYSNDITCHTLCGDRYDPIALPLCLFFFNSTVPPITQPRLALNSLLAEDGLELLIRLPMCQNYIRVLAITPSLWSAGSQTQAFGHAIPAFYTSSPSLLILKKKYVKTSVSVAFWFE